MSEIKNITEVICRYFPNNLHYSSVGYKQSQEYLRLLAIKNRHIKNNTVMKIKNELDRSFKEYEVINWTDLKMYNCFEFRILLHKDQKILDDDIELIKALSNTRKDLHLFISGLDNYYFYFINKTQWHEKDDAWTFQKQYTVTGENKTLIAVLESLMKKLGYIKLSYTEAKTVINNIDLECIDEGHVTVFNCLFSDIEKI